ncbi:MULTISPECIES: hypothetical protein [Bradyrhizobium]|uniref:hypothetical protein n=1 Tax=Bradyrhizobium TaxID=374 RepID=UPI0010A957C5|nr:hypothetical protein [Bradyrhizobium sacchari]
MADWLGRMTRQGFPASSVVRKGDKHLVWPLRLSRTVSAERRQKPLSYQAAELRAKELQTMAFFLIVAYFAILAHALFS